MFPFGKGLCRIPRIALVLILCSASALAAQRHAILFHGERLEIVDRGGLAIWQGDIVLGRTADLLEATRLADLQGGGSLPSGKGTGLGTATGRWPRGSSGLFEIPYVIENDPDAGVPPAIAAFNQQLAGFARAVPRAAEADYVAFSFDASDTTGPCFSSIGRVGGRQSIGGARNCSIGRLVHEMGHAMGLYHEQERSDSSRWVTIDVAGVDPSLAYNYIPGVNTRDLGILRLRLDHALRRDRILQDRRHRHGEHSAGDRVRAARRLFARRPGQPAPPLWSLRLDVVVDSFPSGLTVIVDGVSVVTPATFSWPLGSPHTLDVPAGAQTLGGTVHAFARWSSDAGGSLASRQSITIAPGEGTLTQPAHVPATSVYTANFVRMKAVRFSTSGNRAGVGGTLGVDPQPVSLDGAAGTFYRERQPFTLTPTPNAGASFGRWRGSYFFSTAASTNYTPQMRGPLSFSETLAAYEFTAYFVDFPFATARARAQEGDVLGISATVSRASGASASQRLPYNTTDTTTPWAAGETGTITFPATAVPFASSVRYAFVAANGSPLPGAVLAHPASGQSSQTLVATYNKQYQPYRQVIPSCAGSITLGANADGWVDSGAVMPVTLATNAGWTLAEWRGSLTGGGSSRSLTVTDVPDVTAVLNLVPTPLAVTSLSPPTTPAGRAFTLEINGQGFAPVSRVFVAGVAKTPSSVTATRIVVPLAASDYPATGKVLVTVQNRVGGTGSCALNASATFETTSAELQPRNYTALWWNPSENGWGVNFAHQGNILFGTLYTYDAAGAPLWLMMSNGAMQADGVTFTGDLYRTTGPAFNANPFTPITQANLTKVGTMTASFVDANSGTLSYTVNGAQVNKTIQRLVYGSRAANCLPSTASRAAATNYQDLWWNAAESGWGVNVTHQDNTLFATLFNYDATGKGLWLVMSAGCGRRMAPTSGRSTAPRGRRSTPAPSRRSRKPTSRTWARCASPSPTASAAPSPTPSTACRSPRPSRASCSPAPSRPATRRPGFAPAVAAGRRRSTAPYNPALKAPVRAPVPVIPHA